MGQIRSFTKTVVTAGTRVQVFSNSTVIAEWVRFAVNAGGGEGVIGDSNVIAADGTMRGTPLSTNNSERTGIHINGPISLSSFWADAQSNGTIITGTYMAQKE